MITPVTVTGMYRWAVSGKVTFRLSAPLIDAVGNEIMPRTEIVGRVRAGVLITPATGATGVVLVATDEPGVQPVGVVWDVTEAIDGAPGRTYAIALTRLAPLVDLADLVPITGGAVPVWTTLSGYVTLLGLGDHDSSTVSHGGVDGPTGAGTRRTLGTGALQAADGDHTHRLARVQHNPAVAESTSTTSTTALVAVAGLTAPAFLAPASGEVAVHLEGQAVPLTGTSVYVEVGVLEGAALVAGPVRIIGPIVGLQNRISTTLAITGLVPGSSHVYTAGLRCGPGSNGSGAWYSGGALGPSSLEVRRP